ncbi:hypothetical protein ACMFMG_003148 [Clarireedia jacksonii]
MAQERTHAFERVQMFIVLFLVFTNFTLAQKTSGTSVGTSSSTETSTTASSTSTQTAVAVPGSLNYEYLGCYNETTSVPNTAGLRALYGGPAEANDTMTVGLCLKYCKSNGKQYAGLEYTRYVFMYP